MLLGIQGRGHQGRRVEENLPVVGAIGAVEIQVTGLRHPRLVGRPEAIQVELRYALTVQVDQVIQTAAEQPLHKTLHHIGGQTGEQKGPLGVPTAGVAAAGDRHGVFRVDDIGDFLDGVGGIRGAR